MKIIYTQNFQNQFYDLLTYIAKHSLQNALNFQAEISSKIDDIVIFPYAHRQDPQMNNANIRDLIFKGYVVPFLISNDIYILGIYKQNLWKPNLSEISDLTK
ncbi:type II toxin-antitoxin system RelE/ParE family toxin [Campylobacter hyointestinalis]|uniref:Plasmid stabilization protein n=1 Tax=Campylobacter hyointestinalis subsp. hyointestinalis TaxID=91352 RepID=A0A855NAC7_CAMHY|nr:type II toxin-antitoxin system RelE/ParE family toxin [Campylobacter hyointestinalis]MDL2346170.1 type II toxin-antitoxin system RelE/ParE family toxin [Campylobacter hyointestinalis]MDL2347910.1 type II toxin-antitoxin system RelE/ParE family toxin [Campylobacter hyointestinalis]MDL2349653.1 type II toxin-antitoxin system RelE/ParE family toxin [Campylobacter hyointestinalis]MDM1025672.1 type II toxin-antitoxin system RelE/ParE family toxin [Campylobacter hyointestinalis]MDM1027659.1 type 